MYTKNILLVMSIFIGVIEVKAAEICPIQSRDELLREIIFADQSRFSHEDLAVFGSTCQSNDCYLRKTARQRKNYFLRLMPMTKTRCDSFKWHGYGSRADRKEIVNDPLACLTKKRLILERLELYGNGKIRTCYGSWDKFDAELLHQPTPFSDANKQLCFIGYGYSRTYGNGGICGNIIRYRAGTSISYGFGRKESIQSMMHRRCILKFKMLDGLSGCISLVKFLDFPHLVRAILSSNTKEKEVIDYDDCYVYDLEDVLLPYNYKEFVQYRISPVECTTFEQFSLDLQNAFTRQYDEQRREMDIVKFKNP